MLLRGYTPDNSKRNSYNINNNKRSYKNIDKRYSYNPRYEPIRGSDIFCELPPKNEKYIPDFKLMEELALILKNRRNVNGYLNLSFLSKFLLKYALFKYFIPLGNLTNLEAPFTELTVI